MDGGDWGRGAKINGADLFFRENCGATKAAIVGFAWIVQISDQERDMMFERIEMSI